MLEPSPTELPRDTWLAFRRGWRQRCPACGKGKLYVRYLSVADHCAECGQEFHHHRADDAPPYFTMVIVGHVVIGLLLSTEIHFHPPMWLHGIVFGPMLVLMSLWLLPRIKGALIGYQWALRMHGFGAGPDPALPVAWQPEVDPHV